MGAIFFTAFLRCLGFGLVIGGMIAATPLAAEHFSPLQRLSLETTPALQVSSLEDTPALLPLPPITELHSRHEEPVCRDLPAPSLPPEQERRTLGRFLRLTTLQGEPIELRPGLELLESFYHSDSVLMIFP